MNSSIEKLINESDEFIVLGKKDGTLSSVIKIDTLLMVSESIARLQFVAEEAKDHVFIDNPIEAINHQVLHLLDDLEDGSGTKYAKEIVKAIQAYIDEKE